MNRRRISLIVAVSVALTPLAALAQAFDPSSPALLLAMNQQIAHLVTMIETMKGVLKESATTAGYARQALEGAKFVADTVANPEELIADSMQQWDRLFPNLSALHGSVKEVAGRGETLIRKKIGAQSVGEWAGSLDALRHNAEASAAEVKDRAKQAKTLDFHAMLRERLHTSWQKNAFLGKNAKGILKWDVFKSQRLAAQASEAIADTMQTMAAAVARHAESFDKEVLNKLEMLQQAATSTQRFREEAAGLAIEWQSDPLGHGADVIDVAARRARRR